MKGLRYITSSFAALILALTGAAQSRAYAKFDSKGDIIGLFNLANGDPCREVQSMTGAVRDVKSEVHNSDIVFTFTLVSKDRRRTIGFSLKNDAIPRTDIESLLRDKRYVRVNVETCQNARRLMAEEITRL